jgi:hypothetical protein
MDVKIRKLNNKSHVMVCGFQWSDHVIILIKNSLLEKTREHGRVRFEGETQ